MTISFQHFNSRMGHFTSCDRSAWHGIILIFKHFDRLLNLYKTSTGKYVFLKKAIRIWQIELQYIGVSELPILNIDITPIRIRQHITWYRLSHIRVHALTRSQLIGHAHFPIVFILSKLFTSINVFYIYT